MLSRLFSRAASKQSTLKSLLAVRQLRTTTAVLGGHHHDEAPPPHIPQPASGQRNWFGEAKPARLSRDNEYKPGPDDYMSYIGAFFGVVLTAVAVKKYTLKEDTLHIQGGHKAKEHTHKPEEKHEEVKEEEEVHHEEKKEKVEEKKEEKHEEKDAAHVAEEKKEEKREKEEEGFVVVEKKDAEEATADLHPVVEKKLVIVPVEVEKTNLEEPAPSTSSSTPSEPLPEGQLPDSVPYLLVGGGTASYYAALVIRARDPNARVLIVSDEQHLPYNRPPLSKELWWYGNDRSREHLEYRAPSGRTRDVFQEAEGFFVPPHLLPSTAHGGVSIVTNKRVSRVDAQENKAYLEDGTEIKFDKCLLATGGTPRCLPQLENSSEDVKKRVIYYRGVDDYRRLDEEAGKARSITVIGGGFLGSELAYSIKRKHENIEVNQVIPDHGQLSSVLPEYLSKHANEEMGKMGIKVHAHSTVAAATAEEERVRLALKNKEGEEKSVETDLVVVAIGIKPNTEVAEKSGFEIDPANGGIVADAELRVRGKVFAAGDVCSYFDEKLGRRRNEHWENAQIGGRLAGENMSGGKTAFWYQPSFFTKIAPNLLLNAVGDTSAENETYSVYRANTETGEKYDRGVVFYVKDEKVIGVLLVNLIGAGIDVARRLISDGKAVKDFKEVAKLFPLYENEKPVEEEKKD